MRNVKSVASIIATAALLAACKSPAPVAEPTVVERQPMVGAAAHAHGMKYLTGTEISVTFAGQTHKLPQPFFVLATQNPIEQAGTYPLPEAQLDRFLMEIDVDYPDRDAERRILFETTGADEKNPRLGDLLLPLAADLWQQDMPAVA